MNFMKNIKKIEEEDDIIMQVARDEIDYTTMENFVNFITTSYKVGCSFDFTFSLSIGEFSMTSVDFVDIKLLKESKNQKERIVISYEDTVSHNETTIEIENIYSIRAKVLYTTQKRGDE